MRAVFISDIHLSETTPKVTELFLDFLESLKADPVDQLYILGDLFEYWIGDDDLSPLNQLIANQLKELSQKDISVFYIHGNRDFLLGKDFADRAQMTILDEQEVICINGQKILIMHGDTLCTDDIDYQIFRQKVRNPKWQRNILRLPLFLRRYKAKKYREQSIKEKKQKSTVSMNVNQQTVEQALLQSGADLLIHGHTHQPNCHIMIIAGKEYKRFVLSDWEITGSALEINQNGIQSRIVCFS